ncbi:hypothetical protein G7067_06995 [Leucobacter insecticola]|uniref:LXG domain-containing protein n=1 Tax=Leucobacter insecticola TaxID=2714934 RepID=A0A6G8FIN0_9MICO|nr:hypothetical protein [Leucobacter insecticola]QIM16227.1 hypothetical protein G7067_06995 [Leucobacter insecticola]
MGLVYTSADSAALQSTLTTNLSKARTLFDALEQGSRELVSEISGQGLYSAAYSAISSLHSDVVTPSIVDAKAKLDDIQDDLDSYVSADAGVSAYGSLDEDELTSQLGTLKSLRQATSMELSSARRRMYLASAQGNAYSVATLELLCDDYERQLGDFDTQIQATAQMLQALRDFSSQTSGLFVGKLENLFRAIMATAAFLNDLDELGSDGRVSLLATGGKARDVASVYEALSGRKLTRDKSGVLKWGGDEVYNPAKPNQVKLGQEFYRRMNQYGLDPKVMSSPIKSSLNGLKSGFLSPVDDFRGWGDATKLTKVAKGAGIFGTALTIGSNAHEYFHDGVQGNDIRDFAIDTTIDLGSAAGAMAAGAAIGSAVPPIGTIVGAAAGLTINFLINTPIPGLGGKSVVQGAKDWVKSCWDEGKIKFW